MSKRYDILCVFYNEMASIQLPTDKWRKMSKSPLLTVMPQECPAFYVFDFQAQPLEEAKSVNDMVREKLILMVELFVQHNLSEEPSQVMNEILELVQRKFLANTLGGLVQRVSEVGSKFKIESKEQRIIACEVAFQVTYFRKKSG